MAQDNYGSLGKQMLAVAREFRGERIAFTLFSLAGFVVMLYVAVTAFSESQIDPYQMVAIFGSASTATFSSYKVTDIVGKILKVFESHIDQGGQ